MLLDPPEEQLPAIAACRARRCSPGKGKIVGQENQFQIFLGVEETDAKEFVEVMIGCVDARQHDDLIGTHPGRLVDGTGIHQNELLNHLKSG